MGAVIKLPAFTNESGAALSEMEKEERQLVGTSVLATINHHIAQIGELRSDTANVHLLEFLDESLKALEAAKGIPFHSDGE